MDVKRFSSYISIIIQLSLTFLYSYAVVTCPHSECVVARWSLEDILDYKHYVPVYIEYLRDSYKTRPIKIVSIRPTR